MDQKWDILQQLEIQLIQDFDNQRIQSRRIDELSEELSVSVLERNRLLESLESETHKCKELNDLIIKRDFESKTETEKQRIDWKEENALNLNQIKRLNEELTQIRQQLVVSEQKCHRLDQLAQQKENEIQKHNTFRLTIGSEISQIQRRCETLGKDIQKVDKSLTELKTNVKSANDLNCDLQKQLVQQNTDLMATNKVNEWLETELSETRVKTNNEDIVSEVDIRLLQLTQENDLQKQEILELKQLLKEAIHENKVLIQSMAQNNNNAIESNEYERDSEPMDENLSEYSGSTQTDNS